MSDDFADRIESHSQNAGILNHLKSLADRKVRTSRLASVDTYDVYRNPLGTHPDLFDYFTKTLPQSLPEKCANVFYGRAVLVHPTSAIIFGFATGTHTMLFESGLNPFSHHNWVKGGFKGPGTNKKQNGA